MLFRNDDLPAIADGSVTAALRRWKRPTVRAGGTLVTPIGVLAIDSVDPIEPVDLTDAVAGAAGWDSAEAALASPHLRRDGELFLIRFHVEGADPRIALRDAADLSPDELADVRGRLDRMDRRAAHGPWTRRFLALIRDRPAVRAGDLADEVGRERLPFKADVRKLKSLGLTESLEVGYRLSPRGAAVLAAIERDDA
ncbi:hypothetical protein [Dermatobacter hominis]|uniref:hypothetical protein n=1 Tax=Dermatobacter hominis TaxID=2884263 RepID=UPI001D1254D3|nr:hypothetical protein [Dermatobacter hominis]UDY35749.1 hypothetical protein LH044_20795 [Dermatobacter hominis]